MRLRRRGRRPRISGLKAKGIDVEILAADHLNKADVGASVARQWFDRDGVDVILEGTNSGEALAVASVAHEKNKIPSIPARRPRT